MSSRLKAKYAPPNTPWLPDSGSIHSTSGRRVGTGFDSRGSFLCVDRDPPSGDSNCQPRVRILRDWYRTKWFGLTLVVTRTALLVRDRLGCPPNGFESSGVRIKSQPHYTPAPRVQCAVGCGNPIRSDLYEYDHVLDRHGYLTPQTILLSHQPPVYTNSNVVWVVGRAPQKCHQTVN